MGKSKGPRRRGKSKPEPPQPPSGAGSPPPKLPAERPRWIRVATWIVGTLIVSGTGFVASVYQLGGGPPWPTQPSLVPGSPSFGSSLDIPFIVTNKSALFRLSDLAISCHVRFEAHGPKGASITFAPGIFATIAARGQNPALEPTLTAPYTCPARRIGGVDGIDAADALTGSQVYFTSEYDLRIFGHASAQSGIFTLDTHTVPPQWVPGEPLK